MKRWLIDHSFLILVYAVFVVTSWLYLRDWVKYQGVESWPSVKADIIGVDGDDVSVTTQSRYGVHSVRIDSRTVEFTYTVDGKLYTGKRATANGGGLPINPLNEPWRAFYKPTSPEIAVLARVPYDGTYLLLIAVLSGVIVLVHLWFAVPSIFKRRRPTK